MNAEDAFIFIPGSNRNTVAREALETKSPALGSFPSERRTKPHQPHHMAASDPGATSSVGTC